MVVISPLSLPLVISDRSETKRGSSNIASNSETFLHYPPAWINFFLTLGVGAILEVSLRIGAVVARGFDRGLLSPLNAAGLGLVVMFATVMLTVV